MVNPHSVSLLVHIKLEQQISLSKNLTSKITQIMEDSKQDSEAISELENNSN